MFCIYSPDEDLEQNSLNWYFSAAVCIFFAVLVFGVMCWSRHWLLNPNFNYLSWSYAFAVVAGGIHAFAGLTLLHVSKYLNYLLKILWDVLKLGLDDDGYSYWFACAFVSLFISTWLIKRVIILLIISFHEIPLSSQEAYEARERKRQVSNLMHMEPQGQMGMGMGMMGQGYI